MIVTVKVFPKSSRVQVTETGNGLRVRLTAPAEKDKANKQLIEVLAEYFGVNKSCVKIVKGKKSHEKTVQIDRV